MLKLKNKVIGSVLVFFLCTVCIFLIGKNAFAADVNIDKDVLSVKCQTSVKTNGTSEDTSDDTADLRMVSSLDSLEYKRIGFEVYILNDAGDAVDRKFDKVMKEVFSKIDTKTKGLEYTFSPQIFDVDSNYFITYTLVGIPSEYFDNGILIKPFVIVKGDSSDTRVYGRSRYTTIRDMRAGDSIYLPIENKTVTGDAAAWTVNAGETLYSNSEQVNLSITTGDITVSDGEYTHVKVTGENFNASTLSSVTTFIVSDGTNEVSLQHRNLYYTPDAQNGIVADTSWYTETKGSKYVIVTAADLYGLAAMTDGVANADGSEDLSFADRTIYLANDIMVNSSETIRNAIGQIEAGESVSGVHVWTPIGSVSNKVAFNGKIVGQGHTISGLYYDDEDTLDSIGLFSYTNVKSIIENVSLKDSYFRGNTNVGSIAGRGGGIFRNIYSNATVVSTGGVAGGLVGRVQNTAENTIAGCWFDGSLTITVTNKAQHGGGIVATVTGTSSGSATLTVSNCLTTGTVTASRTSGANFAGGIIGSQQMGSKLTINDCLVTGSVSNASNALGLSTVFGGYNTSTNSNAYNTGSVSIEDVYTTQDYGRSYLVNSDSTHNTVTFEYKINSQAVEFDTDKGSIASAAAVTPVISVDDITDDTATTQSTLSGFDFETEWTAKVGYYPAPSSFANLVEKEDTSLLINGGLEDGGKQWNASTKIGTYEFLTTGGVENSACVVYNITSSSSGATKIGDLQLFQILKTMVVEAGRTYRLTFQAKLDGADAMTLGKIWIRNNEQQGVELGSQKNIVISGNEWSTYTVDIPVSTASEGIRMMLQMGGGVTVPEGGTVKLYLDNLCLVD